MAPPEVAWWRPLFLIALMPIGILGNLEGRFRLSRYLSLNLSFFLVGIYTLTVTSMTDTGLLRIQSTLGGYGDWKGCQLGPQ